MQILARLKKTLIMVRAESNRGSCTSQSKLKLNSVSFRADSTGYNRDRTEPDQDAIGLERNPIRLRRDSIGV